MKKIISFVAILLIGMYCNVIGGVEQDIFIFQRGDVDMSGNVNISDAILIANVAFQGLPAPWCFEQLADVDGSGFVSLADVTALLSYLFDGCDTCLAEPRLISCQ